MKQTILYFSLFFCTFTFSQIANMPTDLVVCDDSSNDGIEAFDLTVQDFVILGGQSPNDFTVSYYSSLSDAVSGNMPLNPFGYFNSTNPETIFARLESSANSNNYDTTSFNLIVEPFPVANTGSLNICAISEDPAMTSWEIRGERMYNALAQFYGSNPSLSSTLYNNDRDAASGTNVIPPSTIFSGVPSTGLTLVHRLESPSGVCFDTENVVFIPIECDAIEFRAFLDANANGTVDATDPIFTPGSFEYEVNSNGQLLNHDSPEAAFFVNAPDPSDVYDVAFRIDTSYQNNYTVNPTTYAGISVTQGAGITTYDFLVTNTSSFDDLVVNVVPNQQPRPGFTYRETVLYSNFGTSTVASGTVQFDFDADLSIVSVSDPNAVVNAGTVDLAFTNLMPFEQRSFQVVMQIPVIPTVNLGDLLTNTASILPNAGDLIPSNNTATSTQVIIGSYDPNDKMESRGPKIDPRTFTSEDFFFYTIRFENTGTASAINVRVEDSIDPLLDINTIEMISSSHEYVMERDGRDVTWSFDNINLPDSTTDPVGANGYILFKIKPMAGFGEGTVIPNTAEIYFDFNPPIITNTFTSTFEVPLSISDEDLDLVSISPNPFQDRLFVKTNDTIVGNMEFRLYDMSGRVVLKELLIGTSSTIELKELSSGMYFAQVRAAGTSQTVKLLRL
jgi:uncharacterized repeat protein (TIGR01451 family)